MTILELTEQCLQYTDLATRLNRRKFIHDQIAQFAAEIKKRCMEECEKRSAQGRWPFGMTNYDKGYKQAAEDCRQAIDRMEVE